MVGQHFDVGIQIEQTILAALDLRLTDRARTVQHLALQIARVHDVRVVSPYLGGRTLGLAKVPKPVAQAVGTRVTARVGDADVAGEIVAHPVYDKERKRAKES